MKYLDEFRDQALSARILDEIRRTVTRPWVIMEVCGGQTHAIVKYGIDQLLPDMIELVHGPGCPVCVTPLEIIDKAISIASMPDVIFCTFGDMLRVPGSSRDLFMAKSEGADIRIVYSPLEAVKIARENPDRKIVFFAVGFETTAPGNAMAVIQAKRENLINFSVLSSHVLVPPAINAILSSPGNRVQGFLAAGHVCAIMGWGEYEPLAVKYKVPIVPTGFEPMDILEGILMTIVMLEAGEYEVRNQYSRIVHRQGNPQAQAAMFKVFEITDRKWRGIGEIPASGLSIRNEFAAFDAENRFPVSEIATQESNRCISGNVLQGKAKPDECPAFGKDCTPARPLGATMVSSEGACAAYFTYQKPEAEIS